jgi:hypothetical protein
MRKRSLLVGVLLLLFTSSHLAQRSIADLRPAHAAALERYLSANTALAFRSENVLDDDYLRSVREWMGAKFRPNYAAADFNRDKIGDFAVLLKRNGKCVDSGATSPQHKRDCPLRLVIFNGRGAGFRVAFARDLMGPAASFIKYDKGLHFGVFETDNTFMLSPTRRGYVAREPDMP